MSKISTKTSDGLTITEAYHYQYRYQSNEQTQYVDQIDYVIGSKTEQETYEYDFEGNISVITTPRGKIQYEYDGLNRLVQEVNNVLGKKYHYTYDAGGNILSKKVTDLESGVSGMNYNGTDYYYRKDILGNIIAIYSGTGVLVAKYEYDAWGNCKILTDTNGIGAINPMRYRSYYYDTEFELYYLQSRYYDPETCRFISPDDVSYLDPETIQGLNLYVYCSNEPVNNKILSTNMSSSIYSYSLTQTVNTLNNTTSTIIPALSFDVALANTDDSGGLPDWIYAKAIYASGSVLNGINLASIELGVAKFGFRTPKLFGDDFSGQINPKLYLEIGVNTAEVSLGLTGLSANYSFLSGEVGLSLSSNVSVSGKIYVGYSTSFDFSKGFKFSGNFGLLPVGYEINIEFDWLTVFFNIFGGI